MIDLNGRVAIVTGAGGGLGREHAVLLATRGARVVVNDLNIEQAQSVADEIKSAGGEVLAIAASVADHDAVDAMIAQVIETWGNIDCLVNNAGILRDKSFAKMTLSDFRLVMDVHLMGAVHCCKAVWPHMQEKGYGRIVMTTSSSGLYGNFGQSNYGAAKMALVGLMQTLALEGARNDIRVNCLAPSASTQMLDGLLPQQELELLQAAHVSPGILTLLNEDAPTRTILCAGAGAFATANITLTAGTHVKVGSDTAELILENWEKITNRNEETVPTSGEAQGRQELAHAGYTRSMPGNG